MTPLVGGKRAGLAGGGVSRLADWLESGELRGVNVTEEISREDSEETSSVQQDRAEDDTQASVEELTRNSWEREKSF